MVDSFLGRGLRMVWRLYRRRDRRSDRLALLQGADFALVRHVRTRVDTGAGLRPPWVLAFGRRRLGPAVNLAVGDGLSQRDRGLERPHGTCARRPWKTDFR